MQRGESGLCQTVHGGALDAAIGDLIIEAMTPLAIEVALTVQQELVNRHEEADRLRRQHVDRARYEADLAQRRFLKVDPDNRLVADALEADWNEKLRALVAAQDAYEKTSAADANVVTDTERAEPTQFYSSAIMHVSDFFEGDLLTVFFIPKTTKADATKKTENVIFAMSQIESDGKRIPDDKRVLFFCSGSQRLVFKAFL
jgi:hypothetical protein